MDEAHRLKICKVVAAAILADTRITDAEHDFLKKLMDRYEIPEEGKREILARNIGEDLNEIVSSLKADGKENELLVELALAVAADGEISSSERALLSRVASLLDVSEIDLESMLKAAVS